MPLRDKIKKAFANSPSNSVRELVPSPQYTAEPRWPSNVYRPDEPLPRLKYRAPVKIEHKKKLDSFVLGSNQRRRSYASEASPRSSRIAPRRDSEHRRTSIQGRRQSQSLRIRTSISAAAGLPAIVGTPNAVRDTRARPATPVTPSDHHKDVSLPTGPTRAEYLQQRSKPFDFQLTPPDTPARICDGDTSEDRRLQAERNKHVFSNSNPFAASNARLDSPVDTRHAGRFGEVIMAH